MTTEQYIKYIRQSIEFIRKSTSYGEAVHHIGRARGQVQILYAGFLLSQEDYTTLNQEVDTEAEWARNELKGGYL